MNDWYGDLLLAILEEGAIVGPRGFTTRELLNVSLRLPLRQNIIASPERRANYRFMVSEWIWMDAGRNDLAPLTKYNRRMAEYSDDGHTLSGAYGPWIKTQMPRVVRLLQEDPATRQAFIKIGSPLQGVSKDVPCTLSFQFLIRDGELHMIANMRSSDAWLGIPYDVFSFSQIGNSLAGRLGVERGDLYLNLGSSHLYEHDWDGADSICYKDSEVPYVTSPPLPYFPPINLQAAWQQEVYNDPCRDQPWDRYYRVLRSKTSTDALEILKEA